MNRKRGRGPGRWWSEAWKRIVAVPLALRMIAVAGVLATLAVGLFERTGALQRFELDAFDAMLRSIPDKGPDERLLIVSITEADTARLGHL